MFVLQREVDTDMLSFGNAQWAVLVWPMTKHCMLGDRLVLRLDFDRTPQFTFVYTLDSWQVLPREVRSPAHFASGGW